MAQWLGWCGLAVGSALLRLSALFFLLSPFVSAQFFQPAKGNEVWRVGDVVDIQYHTTMFNYTIALWHEQRPNNKQGWAILGPVLVRTERGPDTSFKWKVQLYNFDLESSDVFFFWLKHGGPANQENAKAKAMSSHYFRITRQKAPETWTTTATTTTTPESLSTLPSTTDALSTTTQAPTDNLETHDPNASDASGAPSRLPVAAQVGIGVGVSIVGLVSVFCAILWFQYLRKKQRLLAGLEKRMTPFGLPAVDDSWKPPVVPTHQSYFYPIEMDTAQQAVEVPNRIPGAPRSAELPGDSHQWKGFKNWAR